MKKKILQGKFSSTSRGFGFLVLEADDIEDVFIPAEHTMYAMTGDIVEVELSNSSYRRDKKAEGKVIKILTHAITRLVGTVDLNKKTAFVIPDNPKLLDDVFIPRGMRMNAKDGDKVVVELLKYKNKRESAEGRVVKVLGNQFTRDAQVMSVLEEYAIPYEWSESDLNEAKIMPMEVDYSKYSNRESFLDQLVITIDGDDTKDVDDAIYLEKIKDGYRLFVHIADVSEYVKYGSSLDMTAIERGTSVYLVDTVIPMLPKELSNGICSLNEGVDRLCLSCIINFDKDANITSSRLSEGVINVTHHMTYSQISAILDGDIELSEKYSVALPMIRLMDELSEKIDHKREMMGNIEFNTKETKFILDDKGFPIDVMPYPRKDSMRIIENFMISANETVAETYYNKKIPFLYRVHEEPSEEKIAELASILRSCKLHLERSKKMTASIFKKLLDDVRGKDIESFISTAVLRSMMRARYATEPIGHFGLATKYYSHFTSPIRRYADLQIHRIIKEIMHNNYDKKIYEANLTGIADLVSKKQRRADECQREYEKIKKLQFMQKHINMSADGVITHITKYGMYVELPNTIEGMVRLESIRSDRYSFDEKEGKAVGKRTKNKFAIGDRVTIKVLNADLQKRTLDFELVE